MKVIQIIPNFALAGAEIMCENLIYALQEKDIEVIAVSLYDFHSPITDRLEKRGVDIRYLHKKTGLDLSIIKKLYRLFKQEKPDVIHTHLYVTKYAIPAAVLAGVKRRIHTVHNIAKKENGRLGRLLNKWFFKVNRVIPVALSLKIQESIIEEYKLNKERIPVVFNGIDLSKCQPKTNYSFQGNFKILHIGRFMEQKNHRSLIKAFSVFHKKYPHSVLQLIGDGEKKSEIEELVATEGLIDSVQFLGLQSNVYDHLQNADVFTLPSLYEGVPMTLIEAMGTGLPIVATNVGGIPDMLKNGESAILTDLNVETIAKAFLALVEDEQKRRKLGEQAKIEVVKFSAETMANSYCEVYQKI